jgi:hypothetical protein
MTTRLAYIPIDYDRIKVVEDMGQLLNTPWDNTNAILYPRSMTTDFQRLAPHFGSVANIIYAQHHPQNKKSFVPIKNLETLESYRSKLQTYEQKACLNFMINDVHRLSNQCSSLGWILRVQKSYNIDFHFDDGLEEPNTHTIVTTYFGKGTRWIRDEDICYPNSKSPEPKKDAEIFTLQTGDICKFDNKGDPPFCHATNNGFRMVLIAL